LVIESEYRPAREVGGDFFQILPDEADGALLIVAGDVTGKGLKAGMLVALLVGAIRTAVQYDRDPLALLNTLNKRLICRGDAQATCLALRIEASPKPPTLMAGCLALSGYISCCKKSEVPPKWRTPRSSLASKTISASSP
jgi:Stage II sporulation protein E (SpoIIE)